MIEELEQEIASDEVETKETLDEDLSEAGLEEVANEASDEAFESVIEDAGELESEDDAPPVESAGKQDDETGGDEDIDDSSDASNILDIDVPALPDDGRAWYVVHCYSGYENKVRHSIEQRIETMGMQDKIFDVVVPTEEEIEIKDGKRRTVERRVFPGYILVQLIMDEDSWYVVRNTPGVTGFVGMGSEPTPLREDEVAKIMNRMEAEAPKVKFNFQPGEKVRIRSGPFADFIGTVSEIDIERAKVRVLVSFFGRETPVELDFLHVENV